MNNVREPFRHAPRRKMNIAPGVFNSAGDSGESVLSMDVMDSKALPHFQVNWARRTLNK